MVKDPMSLYNSQKPFGRQENPFSRYAPLPQARALPAAPHARPSVANPRREQPDVSSVRPVTPLPKIGKPWPSVQTLGMLLGILVVGFVLLPVSVQKQMFAKVGLGSVVTMQPIEVPVPVDYDYVSSRFGRRWGRRHQGIDLAASAGTPIYAAATGEVVHSGWESGYGKSIVIRQGKGVQTRYAHCSNLRAARGKIVRQGELIAWVGSTGHSTGPHLHFEVIVNGVRRNPEWYYSFKAVPHWYALKAAQGKNWLQKFSDNLARWVHPEN